jgi:hypothetical protein
LGVEEEAELDDLTIGDLDDLERPRLVASSWTSEVSHSTSYRSKAST